MQGLAPWLRAEANMARGENERTLRRWADEVELARVAIAMNEATPGSRQECADLRNVIQAACTSGGLAAMAKAWAKHFPGHPISIAGVRENGNG
jgi:hypothetical protein